MKYDFLQAWQSLGVDAEGALPSDFPLTPLSEQLRAHPWQTPEGHSPDQMRAWIRNVCARLNITPSRLASIADIAASTLNRFLSGKSVNTNLSGVTIDLLEQAVLRLSDKAAIGGEFFSAKDTGVFDISVVGQVGPECFWLEKKHWYTLRMPLPYLMKDFVFFAMQVCGNTMLPEYRDKSIIVFSFLPGHEYDDSYSGQNCLFTRPDEDGTYYIDIGQFMLDPKGFSWVVPIGDGDPAILLQRPGKPPNPATILIGLAEAHYQFTGAPK